MKYAVLGLAVAAAWYGATATERGPAPVRAQETWNWSGRLAAGRTLEVRGISGSITASPATGAEASVRAEKHGRRSDPEDVRIEVVEHEGGVTICAVYPSARRSRPNNCEPGGGNSNTRDNDVEVDFTVMVPRGVHFEGANVNGDVEAVNLDGSVDVSTVNGSVRLETSGGDADASTVNGSIRATVRALGTSAMRFHTVNGGVTLTLPAGINADLSAETVNGSITTDFPIAVMGRMNPRRLSGRIGTGGRVLDIETVNGSIRLNRLP